MMIMMMTMHLNEFENSQAQDKNQCKTERERKEMNKELSGQASQLGWILSMWAPMCTIQWIYAVIMCVWL